MCGVLGYCATKWDPSLEKFFGLQGFNLQHRGQENFGCTYSNGRKFDHFKDRGLVSQVFTKERREHFSKTKPLIAIAQTRYATAGGTDAISAQPHWMTLLDGFYSNATNGDLPPASNRDPEPGEERDRHALRQRRRSDLEEDPPRRAPERLVTSWRGFAASWRRRRERIRVVS
jgi:glutamine phosphoribosylpyrophosphate amidotransferase